MKKVCYMETLRVFIYKASGETINGVSDMIGSDNWRNPEILSEESTVNWIAAQYGHCNFPICDIIPLRWEFYIKRDLILFPESAIDYVVIHELCHWLFQARGNDFQSAVNYT